MHFTNRWNWNLEMLVFMSVTPQGLRITHVYMRNFADRITVLRLVYVHPF